MKKALEKSKILDKKRKRSEYILTEQPIPIVSTILIGIVSMHIRFLGSTVDNPKPCGRPVIRFKHPRNGGHLNLGNLSNEKLFNPGNSEKFRVNR